MIFFVFSYNRGPLLRNCVESVEQCAPASPLVIYDDNSNDPETIAIVDEIAKRHDVRHTDRQRPKDRHGALYANMQHALDSVDGDQLICFLQDDVQLVRPITEEDEKALESYFAENTKAGFLAPVFLRRITKPKTLERFQYEHNLGVYICRHRSKKQAAGVYYSDISVTTSGRLREFGWDFESGEQENEIQARSKFDEMGYMFAPFVMWLPNPPAFRNKKKSFAFRIAEKTNKSGLYPFKIMPKEAVSRLQNREKAQVPIAEDYLEVTVPGLKSPWIYHPLMGSRVLRKLDKLEAFLKRRFQRA